MAMDGVMEQFATGSQLLYGAHQGAKQAAATHPALTALTFVGLATAARAALAGSGAGRSAQPRRR